MMKYLGIVLAVVLTVAAVAVATKDEGTKAGTETVTKTEKNMSGKTLFDFKVKDINNKEVDLSQYKGKVVLVVNVASKCGYTRQYTGLEKIYNKYKDRDFVILGFPCNDFGGQEPGTNEEIKEFCSTKFAVTFPMMDKVAVLGEGKAPLFAWLTNNEVTGSGDIKWNFEKFLINKEGQIVERFISKDEPEGQKITSAIEKLL